jgi:hypothetical protein
MLIRTQNVDRMERLPYPLWPEATISNRCHYARRANATVGSKAFLDAWPFQIQDSSGEKVCSEQNRGGGLQLVAVDATENRHKNTRSNGKTPKARYRQSTRIFRRPNHRRAKYRFARIKDGEAFRPKHPVYEDQPRRQSIKFMPHCKATKRSHQKWCHMEVCLVIYIGER